MTGGLRGGLRSLHTDNQVPRTSACDQLAYIGNTHTLNPQRRGLGSTGSDRIKGFTGLQWPSTAAFNGLQWRGPSRGSKDLQRPADLIPEFGGLERRGVAFHIPMVLHRCHTMDESVADLQRTNNNGHRMERSTGGCCIKTTPLFLWHYTVYHGGTARHNIL